jgi:hypothetical protein
MHLRIGGGLQACAIAGLAVQKCVLNDQVQHIPVGELVWRSAVNTSLVRINLSLVVRVICTPTDSLAARQKRTSRGVSSNPLNGMGIHAPVLLTCDTHRYAAVCQIFKSSSAARNPETIDLDRSVPLNG